MGRYAPPLAFIFPVLVCCTGFAILGVYPFGSRSALIIDGVHQYLGFTRSISGSFRQGTDGFFPVMQWGTAFTAFFPIISAVRSAFWCFC